MSQYPPLLYTLRSLARGASLMRTYLNWHTQSHIIQGRVLDVGAGKHLDYHELQRKEGTVITPLDRSLGGVGAPIDLESDTLPYKSGTYDTVICFNLLEHIFHYRHVLKEMHRVLKQEGRLLGFVPFLVRYHPDPHDYFRYTHESLMLMLCEQGYRNVSVIALGGAMFTVQFNLMAQSLPPFLSVFLYPFYRLLDRLYLRLRPQTATWYPLGYFFVAEK